MIRVKDTQSSEEYIRSVFFKNKRVFYSRFGDGDVYIMMGRDQANHRASDALTAEMIEAFKITDQLYLKGLAINHPRESGMVRGLFAVYKDNSQMQNFLISTFSEIQNGFFESPIFLHYMAVFKPKLANSFLEDVVRHKRKMFIGSIPKAKIEMIIGHVDYYVKTPAKNSYSTIDLWWPEVLKNIHEVEMIIPASGMSTRIINKRLWELGIEIQSFDIGSLVDITDGLQTRKWIRLAGHRVERYVVNSTRRINFLEILNYGCKEMKLGFYRCVKSLYRNY